MPFTTTKQVKYAVDLRSTPYLDWPNEARTLAKVIVSRPGAVEECMRQLDRKDWLVAQVERLQAQNRSIAEWLGEA